MNFGRLKDGYEVRGRDNVLLLMSVLFVAMAVENVDVEASSGRKLKLIPREEG